MAIENLGFDSMEAFADVYYSPPPKNTVYIILSLR